MTTLTPTVRLLLIIWAAAWVAGFLFNLGEVSIAHTFGFSTTGVMGGEWGSILGIAVYPLLHDPLSLFHVLINCLVFYWFGPEVERWNPGRRFPRLLIQASLAGVALRFLFSALSPHFGAPVVGGSGLVACCIAYLAAVMPDLRLNLILLQVRLLPFFLFFTALDLLRLIATFAGQPAGIAADVHLAGALVGWTVAGGWERFPLFARVRGRARARQQEKQQAAAAKDGAELDRILAKISSEGIGSLTPAERKFLERRSKR